MTSQNMLGSYINDVIRVYDLIAGQSYESSAGVQLKDMMN